MKILQVNCVYQKGSTGKIVYDIHQYLLKNSFESIVCYGRGEKVSDSNIYKFCYEFESKLYHLFNLFGWMMYAVCPIATKQLVNIIMDEKPDVVHLHCINSYCVNIYKLLKFLSESNIKTVVTHHAEFYYTGNCGHSYTCTKFQQETGCHNCMILKEATGNNVIDNTHKAWELMRRAFSSFKIENLLFTAVSPWSLKRMEMSPICNSFRCKVVKNGIDTTLFHPSTNEELDYVKNCINSNRKKLILHVTASFSTKKNNPKGGYYIKLLAEMMPQYQFVVISSHIGEVTNLPPNVFLWGSIKEQRHLAALYTLADVTVITSRRETFSMVVAESLCCGTPVVGFMAGGPESIAIDDFSRFVEYANVNKLLDAIELFLNREWNATLISEKAKSIYSKDIMASNYIKLYSDLLLGKIQ